MQSQPEKLILTEIDIERWRFILYTASDGQLIADFSYSPLSFVDASMLIALSESEQAHAIEDRGSLIRLADEIRDHFNEYLPRALDRRNYQIVG